MTTCNESRIFLFSFFFFPRHLHAHDLDLPQRELNISFTGIITLGHGCRRSGGLFLMGRCLCD